MSVLLIDAGNTRVKCCLISPNAEQAQRQQTFDLNDLSEISQWLRRQNLRPKQAYGTNVAGKQAAQAISAQLSAYCVVQWVTAQPKTLHLTNGYTYPERLGADRWMGMLGVSARIDTHQKPLVLASFGTATTVDIVFKNKFMGGVIAPGLQMMGQSLFSHTAQLPVINWHAKNPVEPFTTSTLTAIEAGILAAQTGIVLRQWRVAQTHAQSQPQVIVGGGAYPYVMSDLKRVLEDAASLVGYEQVTVDSFEDPVLDGLRLYANAMNS